MTRPDWFVDIPQRCCAVRWGGWGYLEQHGLFLRTC